MTLTLSPSEIRYSQNSILYKFSNGMRLTSTFARLISGQLSVTSLPVIECIQKDGNWYAASGNRRLFLYKKLQEAGVLSTITVSERYGTGGRNFTTMCSGLYVCFRGYSIECQIQEIISQWKSGQDVVAKWGNAPLSPTRSRSRRYRWSYGDFDLDDLEGIDGLDYGDLYDF